MSETPPAWGIITMGETDREESNKQVSGSLPDHDTPPPAASAASSHEISRHDIETVIDSSRPVSSVVISDSVPETFGRYRIVKLLGEGAMGSVYLAEDTQLRRQVALKVPKFSADASPALLERFYREARAAAALNHPNICSVYDVGEINGQHYITMAYIEGRPLSDFVDADNPAPVDQTVSLVCRLADALQQAHSHGVVHRDLKPANIIVDEHREPIVMDFGVAHQMQSDDVRLTSTGVLLGSPAYMSPEQANCQHELMGPSSDIYSLGVVLYELLTGNIPFQGPLLSVLSQILTDEPRKPSEVREGLDPGLESICLKMMAKQIEDRYQSMSAVYEALSGWVAGDSRTPRPETRIDLAAFDAARAVRDVRLEKLEAYRRRVRSLLQQGRQETALKILKKMANLKDTRYGEYVEWARGEIPRVRRAVREARQDSLSDPALHPEIPRHSTSFLAKFDPMLRKTLVRTGGMVALLLVALGIYSIWLGSGEDLTTPGSSDPLVTEPSTKSGSPPPTIAPFDATTAKQHQQAWAVHLGTPVETTNSIGMKLKLIPAGEFQMGSPASEVGRRGSTSRAAHYEETQHKVTLTKPFELGVYEVTQQQYGKVMGTNPSKFKAPQNPVERVSWNDAVEFCRKLSALPAEKKAGYVYRLPTEAEWEYACRAGTTTKYSFGDSESELGDYAWFGNNSGDKQIDALKIWETDRNNYDERILGNNCRSHPVGGKKPNAWGLYGMHGNVHEWCQDWSGKYPSGSTTDPTGAASGSYRVHRGGCWLRYAGICRSAFRGGGTPDRRDSDWGFRVVRSSMSRKNSIGMDFKLIPSGSFTMGEVIRNRKPQAGHRVTLTKSFDIGVYEVTQAQFQAVMGTNPSNFKGPQNPVEKVSWKDAVEFCRKLSALPAEKKAGYVYRLPTEAEWEYACRAGTRTKYSFGDSESELGDYGWYDKNSGKTTHPVGRLKPNAWGLYDMHGNVYEWCQDWYGEYPSGSTTDPTGAASGSRRVGRGGSWDLISDFCLSAFRFWDSPVYRPFSLGFRVVRSSMSRKNSIGMDFKLIPSGSFTMGSPASEVGRQNEKPLHKVTLTQPFELGVYEVTQEQYQKVMGTNPSNFKGPQNPVEKVSWNDAVEFCLRLSALPAEKKAGYEYRLPTEAEWEYACRAGTTTKYSFGDSESELGDYAWFGNNSGDKQIDALKIWETDQDNYQERMLGNNCRSHPVGGKKPNAWGLYDMHGNVREWCQDWYGKYPSGSTTDPTGASSGSLRVHRGGCGIDGSVNCRSASGGGGNVMKKTLAAFTLGFRVVRSSMSRKNTIGMDFKLIPSGSFMMGEGGDAHKVTLTKPCELGVHEVTQEQYEQVMGTNPSKFKGPQNPVEQVSWNDAVEFCRKLSALPAEKKAGYEYRLPTEAEWEYACRAGTTTKYSFGDSDSELGDYAWFGNNSGDKQIDALKIWETDRNNYDERINGNNCRSHPVGGKKPNPWGLYDMHGNVYEWCQDWYGEYPSGSTTDPTGAASGSIRVRRGGGWHGISGICLSADRRRSTPDFRHLILGFRVLRSSIK